MKAGNVTGDFDISAMANLSMWKVADPTTFLVSLCTVAMDKQTTKSPSRLASVSCSGSDSINTECNAPANRDPLQ